MGSVTLATNIPYTSGVASKSKYICHYWANLETVLIFKRSKFQVVSVGACPKDFEIDGGGDKKSKDPVPNGRRKTKISYV